jgi:hypothetical protein
MASAHFKCIRFSWRSLNSCILLISNCRCASLSNHKEKLSQEIQSFSPANTGHILCLPNAIWDGVGHNAVHSSYDEMLDDVIGLKTGRLSWWRKILLSGSLLRNELLVAINRQLQSRQLASQRHCWTQFCGKFGFI